MLLRDRTPRIPLADRLEREAGDLRKVLSDAVEADPENPRIPIDIVCSPELAWHFGGFLVASEVTVWDLLDDAMALETMALKIRTNLT